MALHQSLADLAELAPRCESRATARGILEEASDVLRNAVAHRDNETELSAWLSRIIDDLVRSPAISSPVRLTGAVATGDMTPTTRVAWLGEDSALEELLTSAGLRAGAVSESVATRADAGLPIGNGGEDALFAEAMSQRPPALQLVNGLPDRDVLVDVHATLISPIAAIARWAAPAPRPTPDRLAIGQERELLSPGDAQSLVLAWGTAQSLAWRNWLDKVDDHPLRLGDLPPLDRTAYGSACRMVAEVVESLGARHTARTNAVQ